jgi:hypothetical protein
MIKERHYFSLRLLQHLDVDANRHGDGNAHERSFSMMKMALGRGSTAGLTNKNTVMTYIDQPV